MAAQPQPPLNPDTKRGAHLLPVHFVTICKLRRLAGVSAHLVSHWRPIGLGLARVGACSRNPKRDRQSKGVKGSLIAQPLNPGRYRSTATPTAFPPPRHNAATPLCTFRRIIS